MRPLSSIQLISQLLKSDSLSPAEREQQLQQLQSLSQRTMQLVGSLLLVSTDESVAEPQPANLIEIVSSASRELQSWLDQRQRPFKVYPRPLQPLLTQRQPVTQIVKTMLTTAPAIDSNEPVEVRFRKDDASVFLRVRDYNSKLSLNDWRRLGDQQFASMIQPQPEAANSSGFDLYVAQQLAERIGGQLDFEPKQIGNCFQLRLPALYQPQIWQASTW